jgi:hypothetical protein
MMEILVVAFSVVIFWYSVVHSTSFLNNGTEPGLVGVAAGFSGKRQRVLDRITGATNCNQAIAVINNIDVNNTD